MQVGIGGALAGIEVVEVLLAEIEHPAAVEGLLVEGGDPVREDGDLIGRTGIVPVRRSGLEEIGVVRAHLVVIGEQVRAPAMKEFGAGLSLRVHERQPVAVRVEPVMVEPATWPGLVVLAVRRIGRGGAERPVLVEPLGGPVAAVGIALGLDEDHGLAQHGLDVRSPRRREVIGHEDHGIHAAGLVAMNAVAQIDHDGHGREVGLSRLRRIGKRQMREPDFFDIPQVLRRRDREKDEGLAFMGAAHDLELHTLRGRRGHGLKIGRHLLTVQVPLAHLPAKELLGRRHPVIVGGAGRQIVIERRAAPQDGGQQAEGG